MPTPDDNADRSLRRGPEPRQSPAWRIVAPIVVFLAGPAIVVVFWALEVYVFDKDLYITSYERIDELMPALPIGFCVGAVAALIVTIRVFLSD